MDKQHQVPPPHHILQKNLLTTCVQLLHRFQRLTKIDGPELQLRTRDVLIEKDSVGQQRVPAAARLHSNASKIMIAIISADINNAA